MNNGLKPSKVTVGIETMPCFSASIARMRISPVMRVVLGTPEAAMQGKLEVSVVGRSKEGKEFIKRSDFVRESFSPDNFNLKNNSSCVLEFTFDSFEYDRVFLESLEEETEAEIYVLVNYCGTEYMATAEMTLLPYNTWYGLDGEPSSIAAFVKYADKSVCSICDGIVESGCINYALSSKKTIAKTVKELYRRLKNCNIIYTRPAGYAANSRQTVRFPDELFGSTSILATPLEIALVFSACAKNIGFDTCLIFVRGSKGEISVLCGIHLVKSAVKQAVCENAEKIASLVDSGDLLIVDPSVFAAAQNTSFAMAVENTAESFIQNSSSLVCMVDVERALEGSAEDIRKTDDFDNMSVRNSVALVYSSLVPSPVMQFLSGNSRSEIEEIPLLLCDFDKTFNDTKAKLKLLPLDFNVNLSDFAAIDKHFSSIITMSSPMARQHFSQNELMKIRVRFERFKERISRNEGDITCGLSDEELYNAASAMSFGKNKKEPYFAFGYVKITDKLTQLVTFAPICLVRAELTYEMGNFYLRQMGAPIVNKVFIRNALKDSGLGYDSFMKALMPTDKKEIFDMFENIRMALSETDDRHVYEIIKEAHVVNIDVDAYVLWSNLALERNKLSENESVRNLFAPKDSPKIQENTDKSSVPSIELYSESIKAVNSNTDVVIEGAFTGEKEDVLVASAKRSITKGESMLVVTDDMEMSEYVTDLFNKAGIGECVYTADEYVLCEDAVKKIKDNLEKYGTESDSAVGFMPEELSEADAVFADYTERINKKHVLGMSLKEAVESYLASCSNVEAYEEISIDKSVFEGADKAKLDYIFGIVNELINISGNLFECCGMDKHLPVNRHPLYHTRPEKKLSEEAKAEVRQAIGMAIPVISEFRDVFLDVNDILGIDDAEIDSIYKLEKLNDLYKLVLSARDVDIPEKFVESDIADFSRSKRFVSEAKKRMEAIEFKLNFFSREIFEDIENVLHGDEYEHNEKGFLKKLISKRTGQEILLQYVPADKKVEFSQHKTEDIYKLLYEYKSCVVNVRKSDEEEGRAAENTAKLARVSEKAAYLIDEISATFDSEKKKRLSNVFRLVSVIPVDAALARKITVVRARLAELYSGSASVFGVISSVLGIDFENVRFDSGILSFDGLGKYLEELDKKLDVSDMWSLWLEKSDEANGFVPGVVKYLEEHGTSGNVDRLFAKSILKPVAECVRDDVLSGFAYDRLGVCKDKYSELYLKARTISENNVLESYRSAVKHAASTTTIDEDSYKGMTLGDLFERTTLPIQKVLPVIVVTKNILTEAVPLAVTFDTVAAIDNRYNGYSMLPALAYGRRTMLFNMSRTEKSALCERMSERVPVYDVCRYTSDKDAYLVSWLISSGAVRNDTVCSTADVSSTELVRMNGTFERTTGRTNKTEAELAMIKATDLVKDNGKTVAITAFTKEQCTAIARMSFVLSRKNREIAKAVSEGRISVCTPDRLYMKKYDYLVVSACFGVDRESRIGWDFGYAGLSAGENVPEAYISISDKLTEKTLFLTSLNIKDSRFIRRTGKNAAIFNSFCEMLADGKIPAPMICGDKDDDDSFLEEVMSCTVGLMPRMALCEGKTHVKHALKSLSEKSVMLLFDNDRGMNMHDELVLKKKLCDEGKTVVTISPSKFVGEDLEETLKSLVTGD